MAPGKDELPVKGPGAEFVFTCSHSALCRLAVGLPILLGHLPMRRRLGRYGVRIRVQAVHSQVHLRRCAPALGASRIHGVLFRSGRWELAVIQTVRAPRRSWLQPAASVFVFTLKLSPLELCPSTLLS